MREKKGAGTKAKLSKADMLKREKAIIADIRAGVLSYREIALKHRVSLPTVNNKARKAGISRGRRKGAKIVVLRPGRKAGRKKTVRKAARKVVRRRVKAAPAAPAAKAIKRRRARRPAARRRVVRRGRPAASPAATKFPRVFRQLVLKHFPKLSLVKFDRLARMVEHETR